MLWHCVDNSSYQGCTLPERPEPYNEDTEDTEEQSWSGVNQDNTLPSTNVEWGQDLSQVEIPKPATDEAEWSDGWRSS